MPFLNLSTALGDYNSVAVNTSYTIANQPPQMTTQTVWLFFIAMSFILLIASRLDIESTAKDLSGVISWIFLLISAIQSFAVDVTNGTAVMAGTTSPYLGAIIETHTIYHYDLIGVGLALCWVFATANLYLLWLDHDRVMDQKDNSDGNKPQWGKPGMKKRGGDGFNEE